MRPQSVAVLCATFAMLATTANSAAGADGNYYLERCRYVAVGDEGDPFGEGFCLGFIVGVDQGIVATAQWLRDATGGKPKTPYCLPDGVTTGQMALIFTKYLRANPEKLHLDGIILYVAAMRKAFPCN